MTHVLVRTADDTRLLHDCQGPCAEGDYVDRNGFAEFERWAPGQYPVAWWSLYDADGEYADGLQLTYDDIPAADSYYPEPTDPQPQTGPVRGFPYSGGRWTA